jgi:predicted dithiol-disulfide oxidoreductase (DUF899 family)
MIESHAIVSREEWIAARKELLAREKDFTRQRDELSQARRQLPWQRVDKGYVFHAESGPRTLAELFGDKRQLVVYHLMFGPDWEQACKSCSFWADHFNGIVAHLAARDVQLMAISRAPLPKLQAYARRLGWTFPWVSSSETDFNFDYGVSFRPEDKAGGRLPYNYDLVARDASEQPGISVFVKGDDGEVFHTYSCYARGIEAVNATYGFLDLVPLGRDEAGLPMPMSWVQRRDEYGR